MYLQYDSFMDNLISANRKSANLYKKKIAQLCLKTVLTVHFLNVFYVQIKSANLRISALRNLFADRPPHDEQILQAERQAQRHRVWSKEEAAGELDTLQQERDRLTHTLHQLTDQLHTQQRDRDRSATEVQELRALVAQLQVGSHQHCI